MTIGPDELRNDETGGEDLSGVEPAPYPDVEVQDGGGEPVEESDGA